METPARQVRARYDADTITVYQAYDPAIAEPAVAAQTFVPPFKRDRMTWIKPSFLWMMYRCGWAAKPGQTRALAIDITRAGFEAALASSCRSRPGAGETTARYRERLRSSPVRVQWDPERDLRLNRLDHRSIQIGLSREAVGSYVDEWIVRIADVTALAREIRAELDAGRDTEAAGLLPAERPYPLPDALAEV